MSTIKCDIIESETHPTAYHISDIVWENAAMAPTSANWYSTAYGNGVYVITGDSSAVLRSTDGINWTNQAAASSDIWTGVTYGKGLFVAVSFGGGVMTSPDGITWTSRTPAESNQWMSVTYGDYNNGTFVAVAQNGTHRVMTSSDGILWATATAAEANGWQSVTYAKTLTGDTNSYFVAVALNGTHRVMYSSDGGTTWNTATASAPNQWVSITYGNNLLVAVSADGTDRVMTSNNVSTWTAKSAAEANTWKSVTFQDTMFVAVSADGTNRSMVSFDGSNWLSRPASEANSWRYVAGVNGIFIAVSFASAVHQIMFTQTSYKTEYGQGPIAPNNIILGRPALQGNEALTLSQGNALYTITSAFVKDIKSNGVEGGTSTSGSWQTRVLNSLSLDPGVTWIKLDIAANQFILLAGTYRLRASVPSFLTARNKSRLRNITSGVSQLDISGYPITGSGYSDSTSGGEVKNILTGTFVITVTSAFEIQQQVQTTRATNGMGVSGVDTTDVETYTQIEINRLNY